MDFWDDSVELLQVAWLKPAGYFHAQLQTAAPDICKSQTEVAGEATPFAEHQLTWLWSETN